MDPISAAEQLRPHLEKIFGQSPKPWPLDVLVVDVDGVDCLIIEELMRVVRPKVIQLEILAHIPPALSVLAAMAHGPFSDLGPRLRHGNLHAYGRLLPELCTAQVSAIWVSSASACHA